MNKKYLKIILTALFVFSCLGITACGKKETDNQTEQVTVAVTEESTTEELTETPTEVTTEETTEVPESKNIEVTDISDTEKEIYVYRDGLKIFGKVYLPEGDGPFPVVVCSNGAGTAYTTYKDIAMKLVENGIAAVCFDFAGAFSPSKSEGSITEYSVLTEAKDLETIIDGIVTLDYIDKDNVFLWGHSMGGFVSAYVGCENPDTIKGMMLAEPSFQFHDEARSYFPEGTEIPDVVTDPLYCGGMFFEDILSFNIYDMMPDYDKDVIIYGGTEKPSIGAEMPEYLERATETFPSAKLLLIENTNHQFNGEGRSVMINDMIEFVRNHAQ